MSTRIAMVLPDHLVTFIDEAVESGRTTNRSRFVAQLLERERRRQIAEHDAAILADVTETDFDRLAEYGAQVRMDDLA